MPEHGDGSLKTNSMAPPCQIPKRESCHFHGVPSTSSNPLRSFLKASEAPWDLGPHDWPQVGCPWQSLTLALEEGRARERRWMMFSSEGGIYSGTTSICCRQNHTIPTGCRTYGSSLTFRRKSRVISRIWLAFLQASGSVLRQMQALSVSCKAEK